MLFPIASSQRQLAYHQFFVTTPSMKILRSHIRAGWSVIAAIVVWCGAAPLPAAILVRSHSPAERYTTKGGECAVAIAELLGFRSTEAFQQANHLAADGIVGEKTWTLMGEKFAAIGGIFSEKAPLSIRLIQSGNEIAIEIRNETNGTIQLAGGVGARGELEVFKIVLRVKYGGMGASGATFNGGHQEIVALPRGSEIGAGENLRVSLTPKIPPGATAGRAGAVAIVSFGECKVARVASETISLRWLTPGGSALAHPTAATASE